MPGVAAPASNKTLSVKGNAQMKCAVCFIELISSLEESKRVCTECEREIKEHFEKDVHRYTVKGFAYRVNHSQMRGGYRNSEGEFNRHNPLKGHTYYALNFKKLISSIETKNRGEDIAKKLLQF